MNRNLQTKDEKNTRGRNKKTKKKDRNKQENWIILSSLYSTYIYGESTESKN